MKVVIYHLNPGQVHADIIEAIAWICPDSAAWAWEHSRVPYVLENAWPPMVAAADAGG